MTEQVQKTALDNGIRILCEAMQGVRSVSVGVLVDVGPKDEGTDERGYSHLVEHMLFQGTGERDARAIAEMMEVGGGAMGAFTTRDYTVYHATVLDEYLPFALEVLGDMLCNSVLPDDALETQRTVILNEMAGGSDPISAVNDLLKRSLWPDSPLGYPTFGLESTLTSVTRDQLLQFVQRHYTANRVIIAGAGNLEQANFAAQVQDSFWQMAAGEQRAPAAPPAARLGSVIAEVRDLPQVYFALAWPAPVYTSLDRYHWHVFTSLFGGGPNSRLYRRLREERGLVYHIAAQYQAYGSAGALVIEGSTLAQTLVPVLAGALIELHRMGSDDINPDDHHRAVQSLVSQHLVSGDSAYVRMSRLALQELYFNQPVPSQDVIAGLNHQSPDAIRAVARQVLEHGLPAIALVGPVTEPVLDAVGSMLADFGEPPTLGLVRPTAPAVLQL